MPSPETSITLGWVGTNVDVIRNVLFMLITILIVSSLPTFVLPYWHILCVLDVFLVFECRFIRRVSYRKQFRLWLQGRVCSQKLFLSSVWYNIEITAGWSIFDTLMKHYHFYVMQFLKPYPKGLLIDGLETSVLVSLTSHSASGQQT